MQLSHSQRNSYNRCPNQYRLERVGYPQTPAFALVAGRSLGRTADLIDRQILDGQVLAEDVVAGLWYVEWDREAGLELENAPMSEWRVSGRRSKLWPDKENQDYWLVSGAEMSVAYLKARLAEEACGTTIWVDDEGTPGIEYPVDFTIGDDINIRGQLDRVMQHADGTLVIRDLKSNSQEPMDKAQLGTYRVGMYETHGIVIDWADYFMFRWGEPTNPYDIRHWTKGLLEMEYGYVKQARELAIYPSHVGQACITCDAKPACAVWGGPEAQQWIDQIPPRS